MRFSGQCPNVVVKGFSCRWARFWKEHGFTYCGIFGGNRLNSNSHGFWSIINGEKRLWIESNNDGSKIWPHWDSKDALRKIQFSDNRQRYFRQKYLIAGGKIQAIQVEHFQEFSSVRFNIIKKQLQKTKHFHESSLPLHHWQTHLLVLYQILIAWLSRWKVGPGKRW